MSETSIRRALIALLAGTLAAGVVAPATASGRPGAAGRLSLMLPGAPVLAGDPVLLRGRLTGPRHAAQAVVLLERLSGRRRFVGVARTRTDARGRWSILRPSGAILTNRLVKASAGGMVSHTATLPVQAELSLTPPPVIESAGARISFTGMLTPRDPGARLALEQLGPGGRWRASAAGRAGSDGRFSIPVGFPEAGPATLRVSFAGDRRAQPAASAPVSLIVEQPLLGSVSLMAQSNPVIGAAGPAAPAPTVTLSGTVTGPTAARRLVTLFARPSEGTDYPPVDTSTTDASGGFAFSASLSRTTAYAVRAADGSLSGQVIVGVQPTVTAAPPLGRLRAGTRLVVAGFVSPAIGGFPAELQRQGRDGAFHTVARGNVAGDGSFRIVGRLGAPGLTRLRVLFAPGLGEMVGASPPATVTVGPALGGVR